MKMTTNIIEQVRQTIRSREHTRKAAILRLKKAGILTGKGKLSSIYASEKKRSAEK